ncbi:Oligo-1,6-glucosidase 1 [Pseudoruegeria aquimaris]|uniref:Oligo-1,6-glucosidase 1 n=1 Tax=Pseudoruegeria aquimaris TaxID=393663 RepID=A0A1Y5S3U8_9RHOB|nr:alpha-glucosidase [Pseudoruegeria aquimaris]SLN31591.1 Oligo-1,6-glucosidase 1 [Pseudoruegeria aquimaris]
MSTPQSLPANGQLAGDADWWRGAVIYQIYPRSFQDDNGDGIGDLAGITRRLDHIASLGADAIWLSPFFTSPMKDMGYDVSDYCDVDPSFGTLADFDALVAKAHGLGLRVMIDQVLSHTSDQHPWFEESRQSREGEKADWYVWADPNPDGTPPTNWQSVFGGAAWTWDARRKQYYLHNFLSSQPDLNFHCPAVQDALLETVRFWLERGVDGFRLDTVNFYFHDQDLRNNPPAGGAGNDVPDINPYGYQDHLYDKTRPENIGFLKRFRALLDEFPGTAAVGEVGDGERSLQTMAEYTADGDRLHMCYSFDMLGPDFSPAHFRGCIEKFEAASEEFSQGNSWPCWAFSNHDVNRHMSRWAHHAEDQVALAKLAGSLLMSLKGSVCLYQGEELGLTEAELQFEDLTDPYGITFWPEFKGRDGCRTPMVWEAAAPNAGFSTANKTWLPVTPPHAAMAVDTQAGQAGSVLEHYRAFLALRKTRPSLIKGDIAFIDWDGGLAFLRRFEGECTLCVFNLAQTPARFSLPEGKVTPLMGIVSGTAAELEGFGLLIADLS